MTLVPRGLQPWRIIPGPKKSCRIIITIYGSYVKAVFFIVPREHTHFGYIFMYDSIMLWEFCHYSFVQRWVFFGLFCVFRVAVVLLLCCVVVVVVVIRSEPKSKTICVVWPKKKIRIISFAFVDCVEVFPSKILPVHRSGNLTLSLA